MLFPDVLKASSPTAHSLGQVLLGRHYHERVALHGKVEVLCELAEVQKLRVTLHLKQVIVSFPDEGDGLELVDGVALLVDGGHASPGAGSEQVGVDQLLPPLYDALHHVQAQHPQRVQDVYTLLHELLVVGVEVGSFLEHAVKLFHLLDAGLPGDDGPYGVLDGRLLVLQVLYLLSNDRHVLVGREAVDGVEEDGAVVVRDDVGVPGLQQLFLQVVHHVCLHASSAVLIGSRTTDFTIYTSSWSLALLP